MKVISKNFRILRYHERMTQKEFAAHLSITQANSSQVEKGDTLPSCGLILKVAGRYPNLNLNWLLKGKGRMFGEDTRMHFPQDSKDQMMRQMADDVRSIYAIVRSLTESTNASPKT
ncbi:MAG: helix-turn-helix domain-containing protein [Cyclobacteriaceae bacterium]|nr:helix-turn-helix domain-containing protein [Cyclobacteriaceae bacterium]